MFRADFEDAKHTRAFGIMGPVSTLALSVRTSLLGPSPTLAMSARAKRMKDQGHDVISFATGEPDFNTPASICEAAIKAIKDGHTKYAPSRGIPALQDAVVKKIQRENRFSVDTSQVVVSCGAKHSLYNAFQTLIDPGDEVVIFAPYWMTYRDQILLAGGVPVEVRTLVGRGFVPDIDDFARAVTPRTRAVVINTPSNPTGGAWDEATLRSVVEHALRHNLWIISDEIYERLIYGATKHISVGAISEAAAARTVTVVGCSKTYSMTGWRIGFAVAPPEVATAMANLQDQVTSNATTFAQFGAVAALNLPGAEVEAMRAEFEARRDLGLKILNEIDGVRTPTPQGAFYFFSDVSARLGANCPTDMDLAEHLLEHAHVATVPGSVFSGDGCLRMSYATSRENIEIGLQRFKETVERL